MAELLGTNRGFELGDISQWVYTYSYPGSSDYGSASAEAVNPKAGTYRGKLYVNTGSVSGAVTSWTALTSEKVAVTPGKKYILSIWSINIQRSSTNPDKFSYQYSAKVKWFNSANALIQTDTVASTLPTGFWRNETETVIAPANAATVAWEITCKITKIDTTNDQSGYHILGIDEASIIPTEVGGYYWIM